MLISSRLRALTAACVVVAGLTIGVAPAAQAAPPVTWTGAVDALWSEPGNWDTGSVPGPIDDVVFPPAVGRTDMVNDLPGGAYFSSIAFTGAGYRVAGDSVQLVAGLAVNHGTGTTTLDVPVTFDTAGTAYVTPGTTLDLDGTLSALGVNLDGGGTLQVDGTLLSPIVLANGSRLTGSGSLSGNGIGATGASTISPGTADGPGNLSYTPVSHLSLPSSSTLHVDIDGPTAGTGHDRLTLSNPSALFNPNGATLDVDLGYRPAVNSSFQIVSQTYASPITGRFNGLSQFASFTSEGVTFSIGYFNSGIVLTVTAVDVPSGTVTVADTSLRAGETSEVTIAFDAPVSGFDNTDLTVANGTLSPVTSSDGGRTWTATLTPAASVNDVSNVITLDNGGVTSAGGNPGFGTTTSNNYAVSTVRPIATIVVADNALRAGETTLVTITFSEAVSGFTNGDLSIANGTLSMVSSSDGGLTWTATLTPSASVEDASNLITLANTGIENGAGNTGTGSTDSNNYAIDTRRPTAGIVVADDAIGIGETSLVTVTFSEAVTGLSLTDLIADNGVLSFPSTADNITFTFTFTPSAAVNDSSNLIRLDGTGVVDLAGNEGSGETSSNNYAIDSTRPTATVVVADTDLRAGETSLVTVTFSEAVTGFDNADLSVANSTLSAVSSSDGGLTWTATLTPAASVRDTSNVLTLDNTGAEDVAGNAGTGTTNSANYSVSTIRPTASIVVADTALGIGETSLVTITFSEAVSGFDNADLSIANGTLSPVSSTDGGVTWTATLTPSPSTSDASNVITLTNGGFQNGDGNAGAGTTTSNNYEVSTIPPIPPDQLGPSSAAAGPEHSQTPTWTITYTASDAASGVASVDLYVQAPGEATYTKVATDSAAQDGEFTYTGAADGTYRFRTVATDRAGNVEPAPAGADVTTVLDTVAPSSRATGPSLGSARTWTITYDATDATSGVASVDLYVQAPGETTYVEVATDSAAQDGEFTYTGAVDGTYRFRTIATDGAGNVEATPAGPDLITVLDTRAPVLRAAGRAPLSFDLSQGRPLALRFRVDEPVSATFRILERGSAVRTFEARAGGPGVLKQLWRGDTDGGARVEPGRYRVVVTAHDAAGNQSRASVPLRVRR